MFFEKKFDNYSLYDTMVKRIEKGHIVMKLVRGKAFILLLVLTMLITAQSFSAYASGSKIVTHDVDSNVDRLFSVEVGMSSSSVITAATFSFRYEKSVVEFREAKVNSSHCEVKAHDTKGRLKLIFLCESGLRLENAPLMFTLRFKLNKKVDTPIEISAFDCVNDKVKSFESPSPVVCKVNYTSSERSASGRKTRSIFGKSYKYKSTASKQNADNHSEEYIYEEDEEPTETYDVAPSVQREDSSLATMFFGIAIIIAAGLIAAAMIFTKPPEDKK